MAGGVSNGEKTVEFLRRIRDETEQTARSGRASPPAWLLFDSTPDAHFNRSITGVDLLREMRRLTSRRGSA
jgi:hypothetical protein